MAHYSEKKARQVYDKLMNNPEFIAFAENEYQERQNCGAFGLRDTFEKDVLSNIEHYDEMWDMHLLCIRMENGDQDVIDAMNKACLDVLKEFDF